MSLLKKANQVSERPALRSLLVDALTVSFGDRRVLDGVSLELGPGESTAIVGRSGSGKSTLLSCLLGLRRPDSGRIEVNGTAMQAGRRSAARLRREEIGMIFQGGELLAELSPVENVMIAGLLGGLSEREARSRSAELLTQLQVPDRVSTVASFSGGEQQRVAIARALVNQPALLLADEPTASLDDETKLQVAELLHTLPDLYGCALVIVTHDRQVAATCERILRLRGGQLEPETTVGLDR